MSESRDAPMCRVGISTKSDVDRCTGKAGDCAFIDALLKLKKSRIQKIFTTHNAQILFKNVVKNTATGAARLESHLDFGVRQLESEVFNDNNNTIFS